MNTYAAVVLLNIIYLVFIVDSGKKKNIQTLRTTTIWPFDCDPYQSGPHSRQIIKTNNGRPTLGIICETCYKRSGVKNRRCTDGVWNESNKPTKCSLIMCGQISLHEEVQIDKIDFDDKIQDIEHYKKELKQNKLWPLNNKSPCGTAIHFSCVDENATIDKISTMKCTKNGWVPNVPRCHAKDTDDRPSVETAGKKNEGEIGQKNKKSRKFNKQPLIPNEILIPSVVGVLVVVCLVISYKFYKLRTMKPYPKSKPMEMSTSPRVMTLSNGQPVPPSVPHRGSPQMGMHFSETPTQYSNGVENPAYAKC
ncbi:unnamed protein product [Owenia fusiformis]|uniref:Sushi domain-containing protein n=1 Tax=Owenia fusiformis TaxID=6347 RepID=A0A8S4N1Q8_OWEFU|nr:unnamed protein product [Owenia fusiformis]